MYTLVTETHLKRSVELARHFDYCKDSVSGRKALDKVWSSFEEMPDVSGLEDELACEILTVCGGIASNYGLSCQNNNYHEKAKDMITQAQEIARFLGDRELMADADKQMALVYSREGRYDNVLVYANSVFSYFTPDEQQSSTVCLLTKVNLIFPFIKSGQLDEALGLILEMESFVAKSEDLRVKTVFHIQAGTYYSVSLDYEKALEHFTESIKFSALSKNENYYGIALNNLSILNLRSSNYEKAHAFNIQSIELYSRLKLDFNLACVLDTKALIYIAENHLRKASVAINESIQLLKRGENYPQLVESFWTRTQIFLLTGETRAAIMQFHDLLDICRNHLSVALTDSYIDKFRQTIYLETGANYHERNENYRRHQLSNALRLSGGTVNQTAAILGIKHQNVSALLRKYPELLQKHNVRARRRRTTSVKKSNDCFHIQIESNRLNYCGLPKGTLVLAHPMPLVSLDLSKPVCFKDLDGGYHCGYLVNNFNMFGFGNDLGDIESSFFDNEIKLTAQIVEFYDEKLDDFRPISDLGI